MKMVCPICFRKVSVTSKMVIRRHGFRRDRWNIKNIKVDSSPCKGSGQIGITDKQNEPLINDINNRN